MTLILEEWGLDAFITRIGLKEGSNTMPRKRGSRGHGRNKEADQTQGVVGGLLQECLSIIQVFCLQAEGSGQKFRLHRQSDVPLVLVHLFMPVPCVRGALFDKFASWMEGWLGDAF